MDDEPAYFIKPVAEWRINATIGEWEDAPAFTLDDEEIGPPDTDVPLTFQDMAGMIDRISTPVDDPCKPLGFDPDDYPFR